MSVQSIQGDISRVQHDILEMERRAVEESRKEASILEQQHRVQASLRSNHSPSSIDSKMCDLTRLAGDLVRVQSAKLELNKRIVSKSADLQRHRERLRQEENQERRRLHEEEQRRRRERERHDRDLQEQLSMSRRAGAQTPTGPIAETRYDFFASHAWEDKGEFVASLVSALKSLGASVWYDDFSLRVGDSLRRSIDRGLANSRFGIVILSENFFRKEWPARELDGLTAMEVAGKARILPIWHKVSKDEVMRYSPILADKVALNTSLLSVDEIAAELRGLLDDRPAAPSP